MLTDLSERAHLPISEPLSHFLDELGDQGSPRLLVAQVGSHGLLTELLNHYSHKAIEDSRVDEKLSQSIPLLTRAFDMVDEVKGEVLLNCNECLVVLNNLLLSLDIGERSSNLRVVYLPVLRESQPAQFVCQPKTLFSGHDCQSAYLLCFGLFYPAENL